MGLIIYLTWTTVSCQHPLMFNAVIWFHVMDHSLTCHYPGLIAQSMLRWQECDFVYSKATEAIVFHSVHVASIFCNVVLIPLIQVPAPTQWEEKLVQGSVEYQLTAVVAHYFDKQPIWARASLTDCLADQGLTLTTFQIKRSIFTLYIWICKHISAISLVQVFYRVLSVCDTVGLAKPEVLLWWCRLLFRTAFYFGYGPFRTLWIKNGYDPRKDPESRMYVTISPGCSEFVGLTYFPHEPSLVMSSMFPIHDVSITELEEAFSLSLRPYFFMFTALPLFEGVAGIRWWTFGYPVLWGKMAMHLKGHKSMSLQVFGHPFCFEKIL